MILLQQCKAENHVSDTQKPQYLGTVQAVGASSARCQVPKLPETTRPGLVLTRHVLGPQLHTHMVREMGQSCGWGFKPREQEELDRAEMS